MRRRAQEPSSTDFSMETLTAVEPSKRTLLDLDSRFFPMGVKPGDLIEMRGPEGSGKTFTLTYFLARFLFIYPSKMAIIMDTAHHFNLETLISILSHLDSAVELPAKGMKGPSTSGNSRVPSTKLTSYLKRLFVIKCFSPEDLLANFISSPPEKCQIEKMLLVNPAITLVVIDSIDFFMYIPSDLTPNGNVLALIRNALQPSSTPLIWTRLFSILQETSTTEPGQQLLTINEQQVTQTLTLEPLPPQPLTQTQQEYPPFANQREMETAEGIHYENLRMECMAYLRSRSMHGNPSASLNRGNWSHRLKFSIFSGMLWVVEDGHGDKGALLEK